MRIVLEIFLGLLYINCILFCFRYFQRNNPLKQYKEHLKDLKTEESTK